MIKVTVTIDEDVRGDQLRFRVACFNPETKQDSVASAETLKDAFQKSFDLMCIGEPGR